MPSESGQLMLTAEEHGEVCFLDNHTQTMKQGLKKHKYPL